MDALPSFLADLPVDDEDETVALDGREGGDDDVEGALHEAARAPDSVAAWDRLEKIAERCGRTDDAAAVYRAVLERRYPPDVARTIAEKAIAFHEAWVGDPEANIRLLDRALAIDPTLEEPFDRLSVLFARDGRWDDLLALYDRVLAADIDEDRRGAILAEAAYVAETWAEDEHRAFAYAKERFDRDPANDRAADEMERRWVRAGRWSDLVELFATRLPFVGEEKRQSLRLRMAEVLLDELGAPNAALDAIEPLLGDPKYDDAACKLLSRIASQNGLDFSARERASATLVARLDEKLERCATR